MHRPAVKRSVFVVIYSLSLICLFVTPWTVTHQTPLSMGFSRQEYWSELLFPSPGDLPDSGTEPKSPALQEDSIQTEPPGKSFLSVENLYLKNNREGTAIMIGKYNHYWNVQTTIPLCSFHMLAR